MSLSCYLSLLLIGAIIISMMSHLGTCQITGGGPAQPGEFPYQLRLSILKPNGGSGICGAVLIDEKTALTAAHCILSQNPNDYVVVAGEHKLNSNEGTEQWLNPNKIHVHPQYNPTNYHNDIAILHFNQDAIIITDHVQMVQIPLQTPSFGDYAVGVASGWGQTRVGVHNFGLFQPTELQMVHLPIVTNLACRIKYNVNTSIITNKMMCAGGHGRDTCKGDSGGPLVIKHYYGSNAHVLIGITSWGSGCGDGHYGIYTRISEYANWIQSAQDVVAGTRRQSCGGLITLRNGEMIQLTYLNQLGQDKTCVWVIRTVKSVPIIISVINIDVSLGGSLTCQKFFTKNNSTVPIFISNQDLGQEIRINFIQTVLVFASKPGQYFKLGFTRSSGGGADKSHILTNRISLIPRQDHYTQLISHAPLPAYPSHDWRFYVFEGNAGYRIKLIVDSIDVELDYDFIKLYAFSREENRFRLLQILSGHSKFSPGKEFVGNEGQAMLIYFQSDDAMEYTGFKLRYKYQLALENSDSCGGFIEVPTQSRLVYQNVKGVNQEEICMWLIQAKNTGPFRYTWQDNSVQRQSDTTELNFHGFPLTPENLFTPLAIGPPGIEQHLDGTRTILTYRSLGGQGFIINLKALGRLEEDKKYKRDTIYLKPEVGRSTTFSWPSSNRLLKYMAYSNIAIFIKATGSKRIRLFLTYLDVESYYDYLIIYKYSKVENRLVNLGMYHGEKGEMRKVFEGGNDEPFLLTFNSNRNVEGTGFVISYIYL